MFSVQGVQDLNRIKDAPFWTRVALLGLALPLFFAVVTAIAILLYEPEAIVFPIVIGVIILVVGSLITFIRPWGLIAGVLVGLFGLMASFDGIDLSLGTPRSYFDFSFPVLILPGAILLLAGSVMGLIQHFKKSTAQSGPPAVVMAIKGVLGIVAVLLAMSAVMTLTMNGSVSAEDKEGATIISAHHSEWNTDALAASASGTTKIVVKNRDPILHTFTVKDLDIDIVVGPGEEKLIEISSPGAGVYGFICEVMGHEDMAGAITTK